MRYLLIIVTLLNLFCVVSNTYLAVTLDKPLYYVAAVLWAVATVCWGYNTVMVWKAHKL